MRSTGFETGRDARFKSQDTWRYRGGHGLKDSLKSQARGKKIKRLRAEKAQNAIESSPYGFIDHPQAVRSLLKAHYLQGLLCRRGVSLLN